MLKRIISALILIPFVLFCIFSANNYFLLALLVLTSLLLCMEIFSIGSFQTRLYLVIPALIAILMQFAAAFLLTSGKISQLIFVYLLLASVFISFAGTAALIALRKNIEQALVMLSVSAFSVLYSGTGLVSFYFIKADFTYGVWACLYLLAVIWIFDAGAYFTGSLLGKHKLNLPASPNKTIEGLIGGFLFSMAAGLFFHRLLPSVLPSDFSGSVIGKFFNNITLLTVFTFFLTVIAFLGDLTESLIKRSFGKKDSGSIIPGHGGIFDGIDSLIPASFIFWIFLQLFK
ncbi:MAG: hypothetical protein A2096_02530 [Spirochaetes bacterium GWF1_41_5]|nr:MAG: hypothetical protein A2096_02530 [Spirochaetes bacterium GWF1_41_5]HBE04542.1 hypothetical protein [Spirochaetia bacterium]